MHLVCNNTQHAIFTQLSIILTEIIKVQVFFLTCFLNICGNSCIPLDSCTLKVTNFEKWCKFEANTPKINCIFFFQEYKLKKSSSNLIISQISVFRTRLIARIFFFYQHLLYNQQVIANSSCEFQTDLVLPASVCQILTMCRTVKHSCCSRWLSDPHDPREKKNKIKSPQ